jgi:hypothetical protein
VNPQTIHQLLQSDPFQAAVTEPNQTEEYYDEEDDEEADRTF